MVTGQLEHVGIERLPEAGAARIAALGGCAMALQLATVLLHTADPDVSLDRYAPPTCLNRSNHAVSGLAIAYIVMYLLMALTIR